MVDANQAISILKSQQKHEFLLWLYPQAKPEQILERYSNSIDKFQKQYGPYEKIGVFSAPGRTEIGGNHTDHQGGNVVSGSVTLDAVGVAAPNGSQVIHLQSEGYEPYTVDLADCSVQEKERNTTQALIRGVAARFIQLGFCVQGFDAYVSSDVLPGSGLSSSAAFEVWLGVVLNDLFCNGAVSAQEIAKIGQYAENVYFGKPSGLQDQMASSVGGAIFIDFCDSANPYIEQLSSSFEDYALCIIDSGADHSDLTDEYAAIPKEMQEIAGYFNKSRMRDVEKDEFIHAFSELRKSYGDRAVLRAFHFIKENALAVSEAAALKSNDMNSFLNDVNASGRSSFMYLQNIYPAGAVRHQDMAIALALCDDLLNGCGACRVHGGGFAGTVQAFVPKDRLEHFKTHIEKLLGKDRCHVLDIRPAGGVVIL